MSCYCNANPTEVVESESEEGLGRCIYCALELWFPPDDTVQDTSSLQIRFKYRIQTRVWLYSDALFLRRRQDKRNAVVGHKGSVDHFGDLWGHKTLNA